MKNEKKDSSSWKIMSIVLGVLIFVIFKSPLFLIFGLLAPSLFGTKE